MSHPCTLCRSHFRDDRGTSCTECCPSYKAYAETYYRDHLPSVHRIRQMVSGEIPWNSEPNDHRATGV